MSRKIRGEGADGFFLKTLTECIGRLGAIDPAKAQKLREEFHADLFKNPLAIENPKEYLRHEGAILDRMFTCKVVELPKPEPVKPNEDMIVPMDIDDATIGDFQLDPEPVNPYTKEGGVLAGVLDEWIATRKHPFVRTVMIDGKKYTVIGTAVIHGNSTNNSVNINCTTGNFKKIRECDEKVLVHFNGRGVSLQKDLPNGQVFFVWLCLYSPGRVFRFWMNRMVDGQRKDDPRGAMRVLITEDAFGWRKVAA
jgi:hypothetical protein